MLIFLIVILANGTVDIHQFTSRTECNMVKHYITAYSKVPPYSSVCMVADQDMVKAEPK